MQAKPLDPKFKMHAVIAKPETGGKWYRGTARGTSWTLFFGATAGATVGVLHLTALANGWKIEVVFDLLDAPVTAFVDRVRDKLDRPAWAPNISGLDLLAVIFYWTLIGLFVALVICLACHRNFRRVILFGIGGGFLVGCLNWLALVNRGYRLCVSFAFLDRPVEPARGPYGLWWIKGQFVLTPIRDLIPYVALAYVVYWLAVGLLLAFIFCVIRILAKKMTARRTHVAEE